MPIVRRASYTGYSFPSRYQKIIVQRSSEFVPRFASNLRPKARIWHDEVVHLRIACELLVPKLLSDFSDLLKVNVANALGEQKCKDVASEFRVIEVAAQDVGGFIKEVVKFRLS
jgi:hypothetical protein